MQIEVVLGDITTIAVDAIVNAANSSLSGGGGVDGAIHRAGGPRILEACRKIVAERGPCATGDAVVTEAGNLPAKYLIHTVGPVWQGGDSGERESLASCYANSLRLADALGCESISFPNVSTGVYGFPKDLAADVVSETMRECMKPGGLKAICRIVFVNFDWENHALYLARFQG